MRDVREILEANDRRNRVVSVACPRCGAPPGETCTNPCGARTVQQHAARWDAWYAEHPA